MERDSLHFSLYHASTPERVCSQANICVKKDFHLFDLIAKFSVVPGDLLVVMVMKHS